MYLQGKGPMTYRDGKKRRKDTLSYGHLKPEGPKRTVAPQNNRIKTLSRYPYSLVSHKCLAFQKGGEKRTEFQHSVKN